ncbi:unnamed protein product [Ranitomeya imitator]|uniref:Uncharacterized protein n=1 Tax=Ranitomeya imitator TaxID=111125 RepID=A0ABN9LKY0_9NEOB|nr:unnamed protein product [Ranitomeya imitator]
MFTLVTGIVGRWRAVCVTALQRPNSDAAAIRIVVGIAAASLSVTVPLGASDFPMAAPFVLWGPNFQTLSDEDPLSLPFPVNYIGECIRTVPYTHDDYARDPKYSLSTLSTIEKAVDWPSLRNFTEQDLEEAKDVSILSCGFYLFAPSDKGTRRTLYADSKSWFLFCALYITISAFIMISYHSPVSGFTSG